MNSNSKQQNNLVTFPECMICLLPLEDNLIAPIHCGHVFHEKCLHKWKDDGHDNCPICKREANQTIKLIYEIKYNIGEDNPNGMDNKSKDLMTTEEIINENTRLHLENKLYKKKDEELNAAYKRNIEKMEEFKIKVEEAIKNTRRYKGEFLKIKYKDDELEKELNEIKSQKEELSKEVEKLRKYKNENEDKNIIKKDLDNILGDTDEDKRDEDLEKQFYLMLNKDDEAKSLKEYFSVLQEKLSKYNETIKDLQKKNKYLTEQLNPSNRNINFLQFSNNIYIQKRKSNQLTNFDKEKSSIKKDFDKNKDIDNNNIFALMSKNMNMNVFKNNIDVDIKNKDIKEEKSAGKDKNDKQKQKITFTNPFLFKTKNTFLKH